MNRTIRKNTIIGVVFLIEILIIYILMDNILNNTIICPSKLSFYEFLKHKIIEFL